MRTKHKLLLRRMFVILLAVAMVFPQGMFSQSTAYAASTTTQIAPVLSATGYRYITIGESYDFNIKNKISGSSYKWESSNGKIATVNNVGVVKAMKTGTAIITSIITTKEKTYKLSAKVYVVKSTSPAEKVNIINKTDYLVLGEKYNLNKSYEPASAKDYINWTSSNTNIATVNERGFVTGLKPGKVTITATTLNGKVSDSVVIVVTTAKTVSDQAGLEKALKDANVITVQIVTNKELEFTIPEGDYSKKNLIVNAPNCSVNNHGVFGEINIEAIKGDTWHEFATGNAIHIYTVNSSIVIEDSASASVYVLTEGSDVRLVIKGSVDIYVDASVNLVITGTSGLVPNVHIEHAGATITTDLALNINASQKATLVLNSSEASNTTVKADSEVNAPDVKGEGSITLNVNGVVQVINSQGGTNNGSTGGNTPTSTPAPTPKPADILKKVTATFGSPYVDGNIESVWANTQVIVPRIYGKPVDESAKYRLMWDDNALYVLAEIKDSKLDKSSGNAYMQDSLELFLDELYDKAASYQSDDTHYRVNFDNLRTYDSGDKTRFYSQTKVTDDGYIVEACITWDGAVTPANGLEMGFDAQINAATNGGRDTTITIFDTTGNSYQNPSLFGKMVLEGKVADAVSGTNPYSLLNYIASVKEIYLDAYINATVIDAPLAAAVEVAGNPASTQEEIDNAFQTLMAAVDTLDDGSGYTKPSAMPKLPAMPDVFTMMNGSKVTTMANWNARKSEISGLYQYYLYGVAPDTSGETVTSEFLNSYTATGWYNDGSGWKNGPHDVAAAANQKFIRINVEKGGKTVDFMATATFPSTKDVNGVVTITPPTHGTYPVMIEIGSLGASQKQYLNDHGYAVIEYSNTEIAADDLSRTGDFYTLYPYGQSWETQTGVLLAWTWGVSKILDVIDADAAGAKNLQISPVNTMVNGVSRNGKSAAVAGAFEPRIKMTIPSSSGEGGLANFRYTSSGKSYNYSSLELSEFVDFDGSDKGTWQNYQNNPMHTVGANESLTNIQAGGEGQWFNDNFQGFTSPEQLPFDQEFLVALATASDRYYYMTSEVNGSDWLNAPGMYVTYLASQNIFDSLGISDNLAIHFHSTGHAFTLEDTKYLVEFADKSFYGVEDGLKDLNHIKDNTIFSLPVNRDPYFDTIAATNGPDLADTGLYTETFEGSLPSIVTAVSGAAISVGSSGTNHVLEVDQSAASYIVIPLVVTGSAISVSGSAITVTGSALNVESVSGSAITVSVSMMYNEDAASTTGFEIGFIENTDGIGTFIPMDTRDETWVGENKDKWIELNSTYTYIGKDFYLYIKGNNLSTYYIDNIKVKKVL